MKYLILTGILLLLYVVSIPIRRRNLTLRKYIGMHENIIVVSKDVPMNYREHFLEWIEKLRLEFPVEIIAAYDVFKEEKIQLELIKKSGNKLGVGVVVIPFQFDVEMTGKFRNENIENYKERIYFRICGNREDRYKELYKGFDFETVQYFYKAGMPKSVGNITGFQTIPNHENL